MTPKEHAADLVEKFYKVSKVTIAGTDTIFRQNAKNLALLAVEQILPCTWKEASYKKWGFIYVDQETTREYWEQVKQELINQ
jgi:hypothetical protein